ncbi:MAG: site-2 protease family protein [Candidatus Buchananbacteria bacterium]|nr:site-2 protease family protein [Candidatus Buchananbacteria bacterium]
MEPLIFIIFIVTFIGSVILHEIAHGFVAYKFGDDTAKISGRLSLNPIVHIDPVGSILVPLMLYVSSAGFLFGWAKPVPVNPLRLNNQPLSYRLVSAAGVVTNLVLAIVSAIVIKITTQYLGIGFNNVGVIFFSSMMQINIVLAIFNMLPLPGFDGWNFLGTFRPIAILMNQTPLANPIFMAQYGLVISIALLFILMPVISLLFNYIFGLFITIFGL